MRAGISEMRAGISNLAVGGRRQNGPFDSQQSGFGRLAISILANCFRFLLGRERERERETATFYSN